MIATRRRPFQSGGSKAVTLPGSVRIGDEVSIAAGDKLLLMDTTGEIPESRLLEFLTQYLEPMFTSWWRSQKAPQPFAERGGISAQQAQGRGTPTETTVIVPPGLYPGVPMYYVTCPRCLNKFYWDMGRGDKGFCPYCGIYLLFRP